MIHRIEFFYFHPVCLFVPDKTSLIHLSKRYLDHLINYIPRRRLWGCLVGSVSLVVSTITFVSFLAILPRALPASFSSRSALARLSGVGINVFFVSANYRLKRPLFISSCPSSRIVMRNVWTCYNLCLASGSSAWRSILQGKDWKRDDCTTPILFDR